jgi:hypothetical protein
MLCCLHSERKGVACLDYDLEPIERKTALEEKEANMTRKSGSPRYHSSLKRAL